MSPDLTKFNQNDWNHFHDVVDGATDQSKPQEELERIFLLLPELLQSETTNWGMNDTVWRENAYLYLMAHPELTA